MNEKEFFVKLCEQWVSQANASLLNAKRLCAEGYKKLEAEYNGKIYDLEFGVREAKIRRENVEKDTKKVDVLLAEAAIEKAQKALEFGRIKAKSDLETGYHNLKLDIEQKTIHLTQEQISLAFAQAEQERGFTI